MLLVGSSSKIKEKGLGAFINSCDRVARFSRFQTSGFEKDFGSRTTDWITGKFWNDQKMFKKLEERKKEYPELEYTWAIGWDIQDEINKKSRADYISICKENGLKSSKVSTGTLAIFYFLNLNMDVSIINYDFGKTNHYFGEAKWKEFRSGPPIKLYPNNNHDWKTEKKVVDILGQERIKIL